MYISGTRLDRLSGLMDVLDDVTFVPLREAYNTQRYQQALAALKKSKGRVKYLVGHSLGGAARAGGQGVRRSAAALFRQRAGEVLSSPVRPHLHTGPRRCGQQSAWLESSFPRWILNPLSSGKQRKVSRTVKQAEEEQDMAELLVAGQSNDEILESLSYKLGPTSE